MSVSNSRINSIESTQDLITGRAGIAPFCKYLEGTGVLNRLDADFSSLKGSSKGLAVRDFFKQMTAWLMDGTSRHITYFDDLKKDEGYAAALETEVKDMASSHAISRMSEKFTKFHEIAFRDILLDYCMERLKLENPSVVEFSVDSMVMNNDEAKKRQGVRCTYKKVKGYHPMQIVWNGMIIDAIFRSGNTPTNEIGKTLAMIERLISRVRQDMGDNTTIVIRLDGGYYDKRIMDYLDRENVAFIVSGRMYESVKEATKGITEGEWDEYKKGNLEWRFAEFGFRSKSWTTYYRAIYTQLMTRDDGQFLLDFARPSNIILTNIGVNNNVLKNMSRKDKQHWLRSKTIIMSHHSRGGDELPHRALKEIGFEELPFHRFSENMVVYQCMVLTLALFEGFKRDALVGVFSPKSYANTIRRKFIDIAGKIVKTGGTIILKLRDSLLDSLSFSEVWTRSCSPPVRI
ncbi:MAG: IS1380 family transposase [Planctomycetes bacterium]|nr:IS1380 family transposase [Planctomycetota bacterium]